MLRRVARGMPLRVSGSVGGSLERLKAAEKTRPSNAEGGADGARNPEGIPGKPGGASRIGGQGANAFAMPLPREGLGIWSLVLLRDPDGGWVSKGGGIEAGAGLRVIRLACGLL